MARIAGHHALQAVIAIVLQLTLMWGGGPCVAAGDPPSDRDRVLPPGTLPDDRRLGPLRDLDGYFSFEPPESLPAWSQRADRVRRDIRVATGLWPDLPRSAPRAVVHGIVDRDTYTVAKVYLESIPGHFVTGNLYRPRGAGGRRPAVLCPHGHWASGRFYDHGQEGVRAEISKVAEQFEVGGRYPLQARCVQLARMGCVVFIYDMVGYGDSQQIPANVIHGLEQPRPEFEGKDQWGFFSAQAELRMLSPLALQTQNSLAALDWLASLPDVDPERIGVTGASGGGTQTMLLCALDPRPAVSFPAVMVSTAMQGGCPCENGSCLRLSAGNVEFAALFAPKPLGLTAADDWTKEMDTKGLPPLRRLYSMLGEPDHVMLASYTQFPHNYNLASRLAMYEWFNRHLRLGASQPITESDYVPLTEAEMHVWDEQHPPPASGPDYERSLLQQMARTAETRMSELWPKDAKSLAEFRKVVAGWLESVTQRHRKEAQSAQLVHRDEAPRGPYRLRRSLCHLAKYGEELPIVTWLPASWDGTAGVVWLHGQGKQALFAADGTPRPEICRLLDAGVAVIGADVIFQGEFQAEGSMVEQNRTVANPRAVAAYTYGYNRAVVAERIGDVLSLVSAWRNDEPRLQQVHLVGLGGAGPWVAGGRALLGDAVQRTAIDTQGVRFKFLTSWKDVGFLPGAVKYGDVPALLALAAPHDLWLGGEQGQVPDLVAAAYDAADAQGHVQSDPAASDDCPRGIAEWLIALKGKR